MKAAHQPDDGAAPRLLGLRDIDQADDLEETWRKAYSSVKKVISGASEQEINSFLQATESAEKQAEVTLGLLCAILTSTSNTQTSTYFRYLSLSVRDGFAFSCVQLKHFILEKYSKMLDVPRKQMQWLLQELVRLKAQNVESICTALMRHIMGGDIGPKNVWLCSSMLKLFLDNRQWLDSSPRLIPVVFYTFTRLIPDHNKPQLLNLRQQEATFVASLFREKFEECAVIGRDLIRLLQDVCRIPEIESVWKDLLYKPSAFSPTFGGMNEILSTKTPRKYLISRLTPEMESQLLFILKNVKMGNQKRYQTWFMQRYLTTGESETLICDLIRYMCGVYHPPNHVLCSDIVPRWALIGWLLKCVKTKYMGKNAQLALFYDWLFFDPQQDNIMNIEPAILLMVHSIPKYADMTCTLIEFLVTSDELYDEQRKDIIRRGIHNSLNTLLSKGVVNSLFPIYQCTRIEPASRKKLKEIFGPFLRTEELTTSKHPTAVNTRSPSSSPTSSKPSSPVVSIHTDAEFAVSPKDLEGFSAGSKETIVDIQGVAPPRKDSLSEIPGSPLISPEVPPSLSSIGRYVGRFMESLKGDPLEKAQKFLFQLLAAWAERCVSTSKAVADLASVLVPLLAKEFADVSLLSLLGQQSAILHSVIFSFCYTNLNHHYALDLLYELGKLEGSIGYRFLVWLLMNEIKKVENSQIAASNHSTNGMAIAERDPVDTLDEIDKAYNYLRQFGRKPIFKAYEVFLEHAMHRNRTQESSEPQLSPSRSISTLLFADFQKCMSDNADVCIQLVPYICRFLSHVVDGCRLPYIQTITSHADPMHTQSLASKLRLGLFELFGKAASAIVEQSYDWESQDQFCLWKLLNGEILVQGSPQVEEFCSQFIIEVQPSLQKRLHKEQKDKEYLSSYAKEQLPFVPSTDEVFSGLLELLSGVRPTAKLVHVILGLPPERNSGRLCTCLLSQWALVDSDFHLLLTTELTAILHEDRGSSEEDERLHLDREQEDDDHEEEEEEEKYDEDEERNEPSTTRNEKHLLRRQEPTTSKHQLRYISNLLRNMENWWKQQQLSLSGSSRGSSGNSRRRNVFSEAHIRETLLELIRSWNWAFPEGSFSSFVAGLTSSLQGLGSTFIETGADSAPNKPLKRKASFPSHPTELPSGPLEAQDRRELQTHPPSTQFDRPTKRIKQSLEHAEAGGTGGNRPQSPILSQDLRLSSSRSQHHGNSSLSFSNSTSLSSSSRRIDEPDLLSLSSSKGQPSTALHSHPQQTDTNTSMPHNPDANPLGDSLGKRKRKVKRISVEETEHE